MTSRVRVYLATSFDGFIAGTNDDLSWLTGAEAPVPEQGESEPGALEFDAFLREVGAMVMGRRTYDVVLGMDAPWFYGELPVLVATHRPLEPAKETVRAVSGDIVSLIEQAREVAGDKDVYLDGGIMVRQALDAGLVDHLVITLIPMVLGEGIPLFAGLKQRHELEILGSYGFRGRALQIHARPRR